MDLTVVLWVLGALIAAITVVVGFLAQWNHGQDKRMGEIEKELAMYMRHTAENYVRGHEIAEVKAAVSALRTEVMASVGELRVQIAHGMDELTKAVYINLGQQKNN